MRERWLTSAGTRSHRGPFRQARTLHRQERRGSRGVQGVFGCEGNARTLRRRCRVPRQAYRAGMLRTRSRRCLSSLISAARPRLPRDTARALQPLPAQSTPDGAQELARRSAFPGNRMHDSGSLTAVSMVPCPDIMTTGIVSIPFAAHSFNKVMPSVSGIQISSSTRSGRPCPRSSRAWLAFSARCT